MLKRTAPPLSSEREWHEKKKEGVLSLWLLVKQCLASSLCPSLRLIRSSATGACATYIAKTRWQTHLGGEDATPLGNSCVALH